MNADDTAILIPAHNDDYCLDLCLASLVKAAVPARIIVLENGSTDATARVADWWARELEHIEAMQTTGETLDYAEGRNRALELTDARHVIFIDSDFVFIDAQLELLRGIIDRTTLGLITFRHCQMVGDFHHVGRADHLDRSHCYVDREAFPDFEWQQTDNGFLRHDYQPAATASIERMFWHLNCVRPDYRLAARLQDRAWFTGEQEERPADRVARMPEWKVHDVACERLHGLWRRGLLRPRSDCNTPPLPRVIEDRLPGRFWMEFEQGAPIGREDNGWTPPWERDDA